MSDQYNLSDLRRYRDRRPTDREALRAIARGLADVDVQLAELRRARGDDQRRLHAMETRLARLSLCVDVALALAVATLVALWAVAR